MALGWLVLSIMYLTGLFWLAKWGDKNSHTARLFTSHPFVYGLALAIYCTAWTFFGAVGEASRDNWNYLPILLGPMLLYLFGYRFLYKLIIVSKKQRITTISDFIASRYGKRQTVAMLVTIIALLSIIPYIALQLRAIDTAFQMISEQQNSHFIVITAAIFIGMFVIYFGTQRVDVTEYRRGLILTVAFESIIKLIALLSVGVFAYSLYESQQISASLFADFSHSEAIDNLFSMPFWAQTLMAAIAVVCLPRQFHIGVIDNFKPEHLNTARWLFPLYLLLIAIVIPVIAGAGKHIFTASDLEPDTYVLGLALFSDATWLKILVFLGGLSASTAMIIVATLTLSTMLTNDLILPKLLSTRNSKQFSSDYSRKILILRRLVIAGILMLSYIYLQQVSARSLASMGLLAFSLVVHLIPAVVGGLYWKKGHAHGVYAGLIAGLIIWMLWLMMPILTDGKVIGEANDLISQAAMLSLLANCIAYWLFSIWAPDRLIDKIQAEAFVHPADIGTPNFKRPHQDVTTGDLITLMEKFMGERRCQQFLANFDNNDNISLNSQTPPEDNFVVHCEQSLSGIIGASSAKALIDNVLTGKKLDLAEVVNVFDSTTQAIQFNMAALLTSLESIDQGISVVDAKLNLVAWNSRYVKFFNYPKGMVRVGAPIESLIHYNASRGECGPGEVDMLVKKRMEHLQNGNPHRFVRQRSDGKVIEMVGNPLPGGGFVTSFNDISTHIEIQHALKESNIDLEKRMEKRTEEVQTINAELRQEIQRRSETEQALIEARQTAEQANASKTRFLALASHDILQPLNAAKLYLSALKEAPMSEQVGSILHKLDHSLSSSETLIETLLDIARLDQGDMTPKIKAFSLNNLLKPLIEEVSMQAERKGLGFEAKLSEQWALADPTYTYRIIQNLLSNAVKYCEQGRVLISVRNRDNQLLIQIRDTGIGISSDEQHKIFDDFYRSNSQNSHGVGLGLSVVARLAAKMNCEVKVQSTLGKGSCFSLVLPVTEASYAQSSQEDAVAVTTFNGLRAFCVDDQQENLDALQVLLEKWGMDVSLTTQPQEADGLAKIHSPNLLMIDYQLGEDQMDGIELILSLKNALPDNVPAILITANRESDIRTRCKELGIYYLNKPIKPHRLKALLKSLL